MSSTTPEINMREVRGREISLIGEIIRFAHDLYSVKSQSRDEYYQVIKTESGWRCSCPDHIWRDKKCKHIFAVEFSTKVRLEVAKGQAVRKVISPIGKLACPKCNSENIVKHGLTHNKYGDLQRYSCKVCNKRFTLNLGFEKMHAPARAITQALQLYFTGESLRNTQKFLRLQGVNVGYSTIYRWIDKYVNLMKGYVENVGFIASPTWRTDELYFKVKGDMKYLFSIMDDQTRFWISQQVADHKGESDVRKLFNDAKEYSRSIPQTIISDGAPNFHTAYKREFSTDMTQHISEIALDGERHNNKMERMNGEIRDWEKVKRGIKVEDTPILPGLQIYHNFVRPHAALNGETPADKAGIKVEGKDKFLTLIQNAAMSRLETGRKSRGVSK